MSNSPYKGMKQSEIPGLRPQPKICRSYAEMTEEERAQKRAWCQKGARAATETYKRRKRMAQDLKALMTRVSPDADLRELLTSLDMGTTIQEAILLAVSNKAMRGDVEAARFVRDTMGEKPREGMDISIDDTPVERMDMSKLSDEDLMRLATQRGESEEAEDDFDTEVGEDEE